METIETSQQATDQSTAPDGDELLPVVVPGPWESINARLQYVVQNRPDALALASPERSYTYRELHETATGWARALRLHTADQPAQRPVALRIEPDARFAAAMLAVVLSGRSVIPIDPMLPASRVDQILELSDAIRITLDGLAALPADATDLPDPAGDTPAVIFFTSGSTGRPKGLVHPHLTWLSQVYGAQQAMQITPQDRLALILPLSFGAGLDILFIALLTGAAALIYDPRLLGPAGALPWLQSQGATTLHATPALLRGLLDTLPRDGVLSGMRLVHTCGEAIHASQIHRLRACAEPGLTYVGGAGASEIGNLAFFPLPADEQVPSGLIPVGYPAANRDVRIVGPDGADLPPGQTGEVYVTSRYLSAGYFKDPEMTAARFTRNPDGSTTYRGGDLGQWDERGVLHLRGRADSAVKVGGYLVEPAEVENALLETTGIREAVVSAVREADATGQPRVRLVAHVVPEATEKPATPAAVRRALRQRLPAWMVPTEIVLLPALPRNDRNKIDRPALRTVTADRVFQAPRSSTERLLANIWAGVLQLPEVSVTADFWELGADSLTVEEMITGVKQATGVTVTYNDLIAAPTVADLAEHVDSRARVPRALPPTAVQLRKGGARQQPAFAFAGGGASALSLLPIVSALTEDVAVYGFHASGFESRGVPDWTMRRVVRRHLRTIRSIGYRGPHLLIGHSFGGLVALEVAQQLRDRGDDVALVVLLDTILPTSVVARAGGQRPPLYGDSVPNLRQRLLMHARLAGAGLVNYPPSVKEDVFWEQSHRIVNRHTPGTWDGRTLLFTAPDNPDEAAWWRLVVTGELEIVPIDGGHSSILRPPFDRPIIERISAELAQLADRPPVLR